MRIQASTRYALRVMQYICMYENKIIRAKELSEELDISYLYIMKILGALKGNNIILSIQGCQGGFQLKRKPQEITVLDVFTAMEGEVNLYAAHPKEEQSNGDERIRDFFDTMEKAIVFAMHKTTLADLFESQPRSGGDMAVGYEEF